MPGDVAVIQENTGPGPEEVTILGSVDLHGDGQRDLWLHTTGTDMDYQSLEWIADGKLKPLGEWSVCQVE